MSEVSVTTKTSGDESTLASADASPRRPSSQRAWYRALFRQKLALTGAIIVGIFAVIAIFGPLVAPHGPTEQFSQLRLTGPSRDNPFGSDEFGRDILSRLLHGARISFEVGVIAVGISAVAGVVLGLIAGYFGGWID